MSVSPVDPASTEPLLIGEWQAVNDLIYAPNVVEMRWIASDALIALSVIAEHADNGEKDDPRSAVMRATAARAIRKARIRLEQAHAREAAV